MREKDLFYKKELIQVLKDKLFALNWLKKQGIWRRKPAKTQRLTFHICFKDNI